MPHRRYVGLALGFWGSLAFWAVPIATCVPLSRAHAQSAQVVVNCGTPNNSPVVGNPYPLTQDQTLTLCTKGGGGGGGTAGGGALSSLPFAPTSATSNATIALTSSAPANGTALPSGSTVTLYSTSALYYALNTSNTTNVTTSSAYLPANTPIPVTVGANGYISAMTVSGSGTLYVAGGSTTLPVSAAGPYVFTALGFQNVSVGTSAVALPSVPSGSTVCFVETESHPIRYRSDGTAPTASVGRFLPITGTSTLWSLELTSNLTGTQFISADGSTATLDVACFK